MQVNSKASHRQTRMRPCGSLSLSEPYMCHSQPTTMMTKTTHNITFGWIKAFLNKFSIFKDRTALHTLNYPQLRGNKRQRNTQSLAASRFVSLTWFVYIKTKWLVRFTLGLDWSRCLPFRSCVWPISSPSPSYSSPQPNNVSVVVLVLSRIAGQPHFYTPPPHGHWVVFRLVLCVDSFVFVPRIVFQAVDVSEDMARRNKDNDVASLCWAIRTGNK